MRKGILTPFHKLKGFERRVQQPGPSRRQSVPDSDDLTSASIAKVVQSMSDFAQARPTTKLIDAKTLPGVDVPTRPFQRLRTPLKHPGSPRTEQLEKQNKKRRKHRRPLPGKRWRKDNLSERFSDESGMLIFPLLGMEKSLIHAVNIFIFFEMLYFLLMLCIS